MVLHTIVDIAEIMINNDSTVSGYGYSKHSSGQEMYTFMQRGNAYFKGEKTQDGFIINRVISTNPSDYLNPQYDIGQTIK